MSSGSSQPSTSKKARVNIHPIDSSAKPTAQDLFGSDSEDDQLEQTKGKNKSPIYSYITRRLANGFSRQIDESKGGAYYIDLKVYQSDEIERVTPVNRWRYSVLTLKNKTNQNTEAWRHLQAFISASREEFKKCTPTFVSSYH